MSARALPGSRDDSYRAGMMATAEAVVYVEGPELETGGTANLTTTAQRISRSEAGDLKAADHVSGGRGPCFSSCAAGSKMARRLPHWIRAPAPRILKAATNGSCARCGVPRWSDPAHRVAGVSCGRVACPLRAARRAAPIG